MKGNELGVLSRPLRSDFVYGFNFLPELRIERNLQSPLLDHSCEGFDDMFRRIGLIDDFDRSPQVACGFIRDSLQVGSLRIRLGFRGFSNELELLVSFGDLLKRFAVSGVADEKLERLE